MSHICIYSDKVIEAVAQRNVHVREMLELRRIAAKHGIINERCERNLTEWIGEWLERNPHQATMLRQELAL